MGGVSFRVARTLSDLSPLYMSDRGHRGGYRQHDGISSLPECLPIVSIEQPQ